METKKLGIIVVLMAAMGAVQAQAKAEWKVPQIEIPLLKGNQLLATLKPRFVNKTATLSIQGEEYKLHLKNDASRCVITNIKTEAQVGFAKGLGRKGGVIEFESGKQLQWTRSGKKDDRVIVFQDGSTMRITTEEIVSTLSSEEREALMAQALVVFRHLYHEYDKERSANTYTPTIVMQ